MLLAIDAARITLTLFFLFYASWSDYKTREVSNKVWIIYAPVAFVLTFISIYLRDFTQLPAYGLSFGLTATFAILLFYLGGFGGADAKAFMCLALALPFQPEHIKPISGTSPISQMFFALTIFNNSVLLAAATAAYMFLRNITWQKKISGKLFDEEFERESLGKKLVVLLTGYKVSIEKLREKWHLYPLEDVEVDSENHLKRKLLTLPKDEGRNEIVDRLAEAIKTGRIKDKVWATPGLPMLIFITAGFVLALLVGDFVWIWVQFLLR